MKNLSLSGQKVFDKVEQLYLDSSRDMGRWMWQNHVQWVAEKTKMLSQKYNANEGLAITGALLHDLGDVKFERTESEHDIWGTTESIKILEHSGYSPSEIDQIIHQVIAPHSCHEGNLPITLEGKILATADAMFHLQTNFFVQLCWMHLPPWMETFSQWNDWVAEKLERDSSVKIFFKDELEEVKPYHQALKSVFVDSRK